MSKALCNETEILIPYLALQKAIEMLITFGVVHEHLQLILLTPQSTGAIEAAEANVRGRLRHEWPESSFLQTRQMQGPRSEEE